MQIIPAVDIRHGRCVRLYRGDRQRETIYGDPVEMALKWQAIGAKRLHVVDLDGAFQGKPMNLEVVRQICTRLSIPVEVGGGVRSLRIIELLLQAGARWVILSTALVKDQDMAEEAGRQFGDHLIAGVDARSGKVAVRGWKEEIPMDALTLARRCEDQGYSAIIYTDILRDGTLSGPNLEETARIARGISIPLIASGGVSCIEDLQMVARLEPLGVTGVIVGKALYDGRIDLKAVLERMRGKNREVPQTQVLSRKKRLC